MRDGADSSATWGRGKIVVIAALILAVGMAIGPMVANGLTTALQMVQISGPITLPAKTPVHAHAQVIIKSDSQYPGALVYTVPSTKWFVIRNVSVHGTGPGKLRRLHLRAFVGPTAGAPTVSQYIPFMGAPGGTTWTDYTAFQEMEWYLAPGSRLSAFPAVYENPPEGPGDVTHSYYIDFEVSGYLVTKP